MYFLCFCDIIKSGGEENGMANCNSIDSGNPDYPVPRSFRVVSEYRWAYASYQGENQGSKES